MATQNKTSTSVKDHYSLETFTQTFTFAGEAAGEVIQMIDVRAGDVVVDAYVLQAALGAGATLSVGNGTDPDGYITATTANTAGLFRMNGVLVNSKYTVADTIDIVTAGGASTGAVTLVVTVKRTY